MYVCVVCLTGSRGRFYSTVSTYRALQALYTFVRASESSSTGVPHPERSVQYYTFQYTSLLSQFYSSNLPHQEALCRSSLEPSLVSRSSSHASPFITITLLTAIAPFQNAKWKPQSTRPRTCGTFIL